MVGRFELPFHRASRSGPSHPDTTTEDFHANHAAAGSLEKALPVSPSTRVGRALTPTPSAGHSPSHFFSLPFWKKPTAPSTDRVDGINHFGRRSSTVFIGSQDKELPQSSSAIPVTKISRRGFEDVDGVPHADVKVIFPVEDEGITTERPSTSQKPSRPGPAPASQSTFTLAQASLGLGLPHIIPNSVSPSSSTSDVSSIAFATSHTRPVQLRQQPNSSSSLRRARSFYRVEQAGLAVQSEEKFTLNSHLEARRLRGLSLGFHKNVVDKKGKHVSTTPIAPSELPAERPKSLRRKSSFWSRHRKPDSAGEGDPFPESGLPLEAVPSLPSVRPVSPFGIEDRRGSLRPPSLQRRHSDRNSFHSSLVSPNDSQSYTRVRPLGRPSTADPSTPSPPTHVPEHPSSPPHPPLPQPPSQPLSSDPLEAFASEVSLRKLRPRSQTNPPFLPRLSLHLFSLPSTHSNNSGSHVTEDGTTASPVSATPSPRSSSSRPTLEIPKPRPNEETPEEYIQRLTEVVSKVDVVGVLASSTDPFNAQALRIYIDRFNFTETPLDVAIRRLLMHVGLPRETQQIDRVMEAFAARYHQCNPDLFSAEDQSYVLAFSLIMLHTDVFNKSNKRKMTKADYIKNTRLPGVAPELLEYFYDNIVFSPFIFIEDPLEGYGQRSQLSDNAPQRMQSTSSLQSTGSSMLLGKPAKIDPYYLIAHDLLGPLRVDVSSALTLDNSYSYHGTVRTWNESELQRAFALGSVIEIGGNEAQYLTSLPMFSMSVGGAPGPMLGNLGAFPAMHSPTSDTRTGSWTLKVTKVGLLSRKEDMLEGGRRSTSRKWKEWSVILTRSQLLFFRDSAWATNLLRQSDESEGRTVLVPHESLIKPDELISVKDTIAVYDRSYTKYPNTFRLIMANGRQCLLQTDDEKGLNEWISYINYASAFKSNNVRMRPMGLSGKDVELTGVAAAAALLQEMRNASGPSVGQSRAWDGDVPDEFVEMLFSKPDANTGSGPSSKQRKTLNGAPALMDLESSSPTTEGAEQFRATFDQVKAELSAGRRMSLDERSLETTRSPSITSIPLSPISPMASSILDSRRNISRSHIIRRRVRDLDIKILAAQGELDAALRLLRNLGVLTPFQRSTRERIQLAVQGALEKATEARVDLARHSCHRDVLRKDLLAERKHFKNSTALALKAAEATLEGQRTASVPSWSFPNHEESTISNLPTPSPSSSLQLASEMLSTNLLFDSPAVEYATYPFVESPIRQGGLDPTFAPSGSLKLASPLPRNNSLSEEIARSSMLYDSVAAMEAADLHVPVQLLASLSEEQAEEWHKTRAAKRVSLVKMPTDLRISTIFGRAVTRTEPGSPRTIDSQQSRSSGTSRQSHTGVFRPSSTVPVTALDF